MAHTKIVSSPKGAESATVVEPVQVIFLVRDNIAGYDSSRLHLRDPQGVRHGFSHYGPNHNLSDNYNLYFIGEPTVYRTYQKTAILPVGSVPGTWDFLM